MANNEETKLAYQQNTDGNIIAGDDSPPEEIFNRNADGQLIRFSDSTFDLKIDTFQPGTIDPDIQVSDLTEGPRQCPGGFSGEFAPGDYAPFLQAVTMGTWGTGISLTQSTLLSCSADKNTSSFTFGTALPTKIGSIITMSGLLTLENNDTFVVTGFTNNDLTISVWPAPVTMASDTSFSVTSAKNLIAPLAGNRVKRKFAFEVANPDIEVSRLFTEFRIGEIKISFSPSSNAKIDVSGLGRQQRIYTSTDSPSTDFPFFKSPEAASASKVINGISGVLMVDGNIVASITSADLALSSPTSGKPVIFNKLLPEIYNGKFKVSGTITTYFLNNQFLCYHEAQQDVSLLLFVTADGDRTKSVSFFMPRVRFTGAGIGFQAEEGQTITLPFQAMKFKGSVTGYPETTIRIVDTGVA